MGVEAWTHPHTDTHIHFYWARIQIHKGFLFSQKTLLALFSGTFWLVFNYCCCFPTFYFVCIYVCVLLYVCVCAFTSFLWEKSRNRYEPASCLPCHAPSSNIFIFFYVSPSEGGARCSGAPLLTARFSQLFWAPSTAAEQFWGLTLTRLRHTRARTLKVGVEVRPTTRTRHLDECCLLSLGFGV